MRKEKHRKHSLNLVDSISIIANLFSITNYLVIWLSADLGSTSPEEIKGLFQVLPLAFQDHAILTGCITVIGLMFVSMKVWGYATLGTSIPLSILIWFVIQFIVSMFLVLLWWLIFRQVLGASGDIIASLPSFGLLLTIVIIATGIFGFFLHLGVVSHS